MVRNRSTPPLLAATLAATLATSAAARDLAPVGDKDTAKVIAVVTSIPLAVDLAAYDLAEKAFAGSIVVDYTSLWGGSAASMTPAELMTAWRGIVPGFDATWHQLSDVAATISGDSAEATAFVDGRHWLGDKLWRPVGTYHWRLARQAGGWKVTHMTFTLTQEIGDRGLAAIATERAKAKSN